MTFRIAHCSDLHLGYKSTRLNNAQGINLREADGYVAFSRVVNDIIASEVDAVVIAGDIFHSPHPEIRTIVFAQNQFRKLWEAGIAIYSLTGNHDTNDIKADVAATRILHDPWRKIHSHIEPYVQYEITPGVHLHLVSHHMYGEQTQTMQEVKPIPGAINIFSTHGSVIDPLLQEKLHTEQSPREIVIPDFLLQDRDWSYTMLGHIHERGWVGSKNLKEDTSRTNIFYNGSLIRRGFSDKEVPLGRGWTLWEIGDDGSFSYDIRSVAQRPQLDFATIDADKLTSAQITDKVISHLQASQLDGVAFDPKTAPILRQKLINVTPAKYAALDWRTIAQQSGHAMQWAIKSVARPEEPVLDADGKPQETLTEGADVVKIYDDWAPTSKAIASAEEELRIRITDQARKFVTLGQEATLDED
jgi:DNA repair exonuclease SbcCD nuclease subunit